MAKIYPCGADFVMIVLPPTDLATQSHEPFLCPCDCEAGIVNLVLPRVKITPQSTNFLVIETERNLG